MKAASITIHRPVNFGSALQTLATQMVWERMGVELETIDYIPPRLQYKQRLKLLVSNHSQPWKKRLATFLTMDVINRRIFNQFIRRYVHVSPRTYYSLEELQKYYPQADLYMTGSDQVWNSFYNRGVDSAFFLSFLPDDTPRFSFASSFGSAQLIEAEKGPIGKALSKYRYISVREQSAVKLIEQMGLPTPTLLPDPTLLLNKEEWVSLFPQPSYNQPYVLIYPMSQMDPELFVAARQAATLLKAEVWCLSPGLKKYSQCDRTLRFRSPEEFVALMNQASFVVTNSFHGTAFAINLGRPFTTLLPYDFGTRIESLLERLNLTWRIHKEGAEITPCLEPLPYDAIRTKLDADREACRQFMSDILESVK